MTLLESLAALVILGTTAVGFLEVFHTSARATREASEWAETVGYAESLMESAKVGEADAGGVGIAAPRGFDGRIETRAWAPGVREVIVVVTSPGGRRLELRRLARNQESGGSLR
jgi:type II secretory pathway pseudopilin PulG